MVSYFKCPSYSIAPVFKIELPKRAVSVFVQLISLSLIKISKIRVLQTTSRGVGNSHKTSKLNIKPNILWEELKKSKFEHTPEYYKYDQIFKYSII